MNDFKIGSFYVLGLLCWIIFIATQDPGWAACGLLWGVLARQQEDRAR